MRRPSLVERLGREEWSDGRRVGRKSKGVVSKKRRLMATAGGWDGTWEEESGGRARGGRGGGEGGSASEPRPRKNLTVRN